MKYVIDWVGYKILKGNIEDIYKGENLSYKICDQWVEEEMAFDSLDDAIKLIDDEIQLNKQQINNFEIENHKLNNMIKNAINSEDL